MIARSFALTIIVLILVVPAKAHFMSALVRQRDFNADQSGSAVSEHRVLIAGASSDFRESVVRSVVDSLTVDSFFVKVTRFKDLRNEDPSNWDAIVLVNTCIAWDIENRVRKYIAGNSSYRRFILFTTSGDPDSCCSSSKLPAGVDALSSASAKTRKQPAIDALLVKIRRMVLGREGRDSSWQALDGRTGATSKR